MKRRCLRMVLLVAVTTSLTACSSMPTWHGTWWGYAEPATVYDANTNSYDVLQFRITQHPRAEPADLYDEFVLQRSDWPLLVKEKKVCLTAEDLPRDRLLQLSGTMKARYVKDPAGRVDVERSVFTNYVGEEFIIHVDYDTLEGYRSKP